MSQFSNVFRVTTFESGVVRISLREMIPSEDGSTMAVAEVGAFSMLAADARSLAETIIKLLDAQPGQEKMN